MCFDEKNVIGPFFFEELVMTGDTFLTMMEEMLLCHVCWEHFSSYMCTVTLLPSCLCLSGWSLMIIG
jgi:hypothetical protein